MPSACRAIAEFRFNRLAGFLLAVVLITARIAGWARAIYSMADQNACPTWCSVTTTPNGCYAPTWSIATGMIWPIEARIAVEDDDPVAVRAAGELDEVARSSPRCFWPGRSALRRAPRLAGR